ncbi:hypothetical protein EWB00_008882 [Schistosoma japonicum]|uniref:Uncharacterized protein n=1 Tax=Schistosoma japonicum TaxID=6182 RepID=A0A4Z2DS72_SCHJA|nr:hypothetical protein EWB00_008882 [Schistosoma japonicum]
MSHQKVFMKNIPKSNCQKDFTNVKIHNHLNPIKQKRKHTLRHHINMSLNENNRNQHEFIELSRMNNNQCMSNIQQRLNHIEMKSNR